MQVFSFYRDIFMAIYVLLIPYTLTIAFLVFGMKNKKISGWFYLMSFVSFLCFCIRKIPEGLSDHCSRVNQNHDMSDFSVHVGYGMNFCKKIIEPYLSSNFIDLLVLVVGIVFLCIAIKSLYSDLKGS